MPNNKRRTARNTHSHRSFSHSRQPSFNSNDEVQRRASSAFSSSSRNPNQTNDMVVFLQQRTTTNDVSYQTRQIPIVRITRECVVCVTEKSIEEFEGIYGDSCVHVERAVCNSCLYENTKALVEDSMFYFGHITCPESNCHGTFDYQGIRQILVFIGKNNALFEQYDQHLINLHLSQMPEFLWCAYGCGSGQLYDFAATSNPVVICVKCNRRTCFIHRVIWHTDMTCDQYDLLENQPTQTDANNKWLELFAKQCPQCRWHIQKNEGCDHMTCRYCKHEFCWECFADYKLIADNGSSRHKPTCSHYQPDAATSSNQS